MEQYERYHTFPEYKPSGTYPDYQTVWQHQYVLTDHQGTLETHLWYSLVSRMMWRARGFMPWGIRSSATLRGTFSPVSRFNINTDSKISCKNVQIRDHKH